jgi:DNA-binding NtrC family response regulator
VLLRGGSGTGKELAARAVHTLSQRSKGPFVARNAATLPSGIVDAELFGNVKNYPNAGMPERQGLVGQADRGTLFLDEVGELPDEVQAHLLRLLDSEGEYHRLGESRSRRADFRLVGATNRALSTMRPDLLARFALDVELPSLEARREDIPLLARHLVLRAAKNTPEVAERFVRQAPGARDEISFDPALISALLRRSYPLNVRELDKVLWRAMAATLDSMVRLPSELRPPTPASPDPSAGKSAAEADLDDLLSGLSGRRLSEEIVRAALEQQHGRIQAAAEALRVSRHALARLMKKYGIPRR